jgi:hypothetical protein
MIRWWKERRRRARALADVVATTATLQDLEHAYDMGWLARHQYWTAKAALEIRLERQRAAAGRHVFVKPDPIIADAHASGSSVAAEHYRQYLERGGRG